MTQDEIIEMARQAGCGPTLLKHWPFQLEAFAKLIAEKTQMEMQDRINTLHAMYEQACKQRDELMDGQRLQIAAIRAKLKEKNT